MDTRNRGHKRISSLLLHGVQLCAPLWAFTESGINRVILKSGNVVDNNGTSPMPRDQAGYTRAGHRCIPQQYDPREASVQLAQKGGPQ